jgi:hypothetical protein
MREERLPRFSKDEMPRPPARPPAPATPTVLAAPTTTAAASR